MISNTLHELDRLRRIIDVNSNLCHRLKHDRDNARKQRDELRKSCLELLALVPAERPEEGGYPQWVSDILERARAAVANETT